jgi:hypothetical protein
VDDPGAMPASAVPASHPARRPPLIASLNVLADFCADPARAFRFLRERPTYGLALFLAVGCGVLEWYLTLPAVHHAIQVTVPAQVASDPEAMKFHLDGAQIEAIVTRTQALANLRWWVPAVAVPLTVLLQAVLLAGLQIRSASRASFQTLFALSAHTSLVGYGFGALANGLIVVLRSPEGFNSRADLLDAVPNLAWIAGHAPSTVQDALMAITPFTVWSAALLVVGFQRVAGVRLAAGLVAAAVVLGATIATRLLTLRGGP